MDRSLEKFGEKGQVGYGAVVKQIIRIERRLLQNRRHHGAFL